MQIMKKSLKSAIRIICFLLLLSAVLLAANRVLKPKNDDGIYNMELFYELPENSLDVVFLGSSHAYCGFNTGVLWREYGLASYVLAGSQQPMWNSYHCLAEALKTQKPRLVILEGYMLYIDTPYRDDSMVIRNTFGLKLSKNRLEAIKASAPRENWPGFFLAYTQYHTRYRDLSMADLLPYQGVDWYENWKGTTLKDNVEPFPEHVPIATDIRSPLQERTEEYYRKIMELCQKENIPLLVVVAPYVTTEEKQARFNTGADIAAEYGVPFVDYNLRYSEIPMDFEADMADEGHLNAAGGAKFTRTLGVYLKENYSFPDHTGDPIYDTWTRDAEHIYEVLGE